MTQDNLIRYVGYDIYFSFDAIFMALPRMTVDAKNKLKRELKDHVPFATGWNRKVWFKQSDLEIYLSERYPNAFVQKRLKDYAIYPKVLHYAGADELFKLLEEEHRELARLYNRLHYFPEDVETAEQVVAHEDHAYILRIILLGEFGPNYRRAAKNARDDDYGYRYASQLLDTYRNKAWEEKRFDHETTDILKAKAGRKDAS